MRHLSAALLFVFLFLFSNISRGQENKLINADFQNEPFQRFVTKLEQIYPCHIFYDSTSLNSSTVTLKAQQVSLPQLLEKVFNHTSFHYAIDEQNHVFITRNPILTHFSNGFFNSKNSVDSVSTGEYYLADEPSEKQILNVSIENKLFEVGTKNINSKTANATIAGYVRDQKNGEPIAGATVYLDKPVARATTDQFGYYSLTLPKGRHTLKINSIGMQPTSRQILLQSDGKLDVELTDFVASLKAVIVSAEKKSNIQSLQMGAVKLNTRTIKQVPVAFGEPDLLKVVLTLPGVTSVGEASTGFNVRGGSTDENLILFNDATIYNPSHLFGFFSAFNSDVVKSVELYKSAIPEKFGGRLSSVLDITEKDGNNKQWSGNAGIGPLTSEFAIDGPLIKNKTSIVLGGRTTYANWLLHDLPDAYNKSTASFYDINLHITHTINAHNSIYLTGYLSNDNFKLNGDTTYQYSNKNANIKWKHIFNNKLNGVATVGIDNYGYSVSSTFIPVDGYTLGFNINQKNIKLDFSYTPNYRHTIIFGLSSIYYQLKSGTYSPYGEGSLAAPVNIPKEQALETAAYLGDQFHISSKFSINAGLRYALYNYLGPHDVYGYVPNEPRTVYTLIDTTHYGSGKIIKTYQAPEIRLSLRYSLSDVQSLKLSYNTLNQYIHMISNTIAIAPTDIWKLSDPYIKPQQGDQISIGWYQNFRSNSIETSVEVYYKRLKNYLDYKSGAELILNPHIETEVFNTIGKAYGIELLIKKTEGKLNGWFSYTYSRTFLKENDPLAGELINNGNYYPASFDKPHNANLIANYRFSHRYSISSNIVYSTGRPITLPVDVFNIGGSTSLYYSERNQYRVPDYFRADLSVNIDGNHKIKQRFHNSWSAGVYNLTGRQNAYSVYFTDVNGKIQGYQLSIFGTIIPFVTYHIKF